MKIELSVSELKQLSKPETLDAQPRNTNYSTGEPHVLLSTIRLTHQGLILQAIKEHREYSGLGLKEAKDVLDLIRNFK